MSSFAAAGQAQVVERHRVDREDGDRGAVLRRHVAERGAVGDGQRRQARAEELDELADDALLAQALGHGQHEVGRGRALGQLALEADADDLGDQHRDRLAEHRGLGFDAADAPADDAEAVDHRRVRVGADQRVRERLQDAVTCLAADDPGEVFEVHLVDDAGLGRDDAEVAEGALAPAQEDVALAVALVFELAVQLEGGRLAEVVDLHRVVDDELDRLQRVDVLRIAAERRHAVAHRRQIDHGRDAREVLQQHPRRRERDLALGVLGRVPAGQGGDVVLLDVGAVLHAEEVFEQDAQRVGQPGDLREAGLLEGRQADVFDRAVGGLERGPCTERVEPCHRNQKCYHRGRAAGGMTSYNRPDSLRR